jgi:hypothetical protein
MWLIIKEYKNRHGVVLPVLMLNGLGEVLEFKTELEALEFANIMQKNTDSGWVYSVKKVGQ